MIAEPPEQRPVHGTALADEIAFRLRAEILDGKLPGGARLQHEELAVRFGVSRTPIREALRQLKAMNLVVVVPNRGATVRVPSRTEVADVYELRADLEGLACELACARAREQDLDELDRAQARLTEVVAAAERLGEAELDAAVATWNTAFHRCVHQASGNRRLVETIEQLRAFFPRDSVWRALAHDHAALTTMNVTEHDTIAAALRARDARRARGAMRDHVQGAGEILLAYLDDQGFWS
ncbi:GntR family transcriptional regulator [Nonomuraea sp. NPDC050643]|uniref:GntR family transcriptional regulator n=1 Tax=Nonomuraea sp. NPDC050643 TaxID=3155660 RepID=UPI0033EEE03A